MFNFLTDGDLHNPTSTSFELTYKCTSPVGMYRRRGLPLCLNQNGLYVRKNSPLRPSDVKVLYIGINIYKQVKKPFVTYSVRFM